MPLLPAWFYKEVEDKDETEKEPKANKLQRKPKILPIIVLVVIIVGGIFAWYWYSYRPSAVREFCNAEAEKGGGRQYEYNYGKCMRSRGLDSSHGLD